MGGYGYKGSTEVNLVDMRGSCYTVSTVAITTDIGGSSYTECTITQPDSLPTT